MGEWKQWSQTHVSHMEHGDFYHGEKSLTLDKQTGTQPIVAVELKQSLIEHLCALAGIAPGDVALHDLFVFDTQRPAVIGVEREFLASGRLDNLACTHAALTAISSAEAGASLRSASSSTTPSA